MAKDKTFVPNIKDLNAILNTVHNHYGGNHYSSRRPRSDKLAELKQAEEDAEAALEEYKRSDSKLAVLESAAAAAERARRRYEEKEETTVSKLVNKIRNELRLKGPTPEIVKAITDLAEKYQ